MNEIVKKIDELRNDISVMNFQERLSSEDYKSIHDMEAEIKTLLEKLKGVKLVALKLTHKQCKYTAYLTCSPNLCFCDNPTWFDSNEEAMAYLSRAQLNPNDYIIEYEWREF